MSFVDKYKNQLETSNDDTFSNAKGALNSLTEWKQFVMDKLINDDELSKLLYYNTPDAIFRENLTQKQKDSLHHTKVFGFKYNPEIMQDASQFITVSTSKFAPHETFRKISDNYTTGYVIFYIYVSTKNMITDMGYRQDLIASRIEQIFNGISKLGIGKFVWETTAEAWEHDGKLGGYVIGFKVTDFK